MILRDGVWTMRTDAARKGKPGKLKLPQVAFDSFKHNPRFVGNPYVFAGRNNGPTAMFGSGTYKAQFDKLCGVTDWRSSRSEKDGAVADVPRRSPNRDSRKSFRSRAGRADSDLR